METMGLSWEGGRKEGGKGRAGGGNRGEGVESEKRAGKTLLLLHQGRSSF